MAAFDVIRPTFVSGIEVSGRSLWTHREISHLCAMVCDEYSSIFNPKKRIVVSYDYHLHVAFTLHRAFKMVGIKHTYREPETLEPSYLENLMEHTKAHCLSLVKRAQVAAGMRQYPSDENLTYVRDEIANLKTWFRSNARSWWIYDEYIAVREMEKQLVNMVRQNNLSKAESFPQIDSEDIEKFLDLVFRSMRHNRPKMLLDAVRSDDSILSRTDPEFEHQMTAFATELCRQSERRRHFERSRTGRNVAHSAMMKISRSYIKTSATQRRMVSAIYSYFGKIPPFSS